MRNLDNGRYWHSAGGTAGNVSVFASAMGIETTILSRIGRDRRGELLLRLLSDAGVDTSRTERVPHLRTPGIVELIRGTPDGAHRFTYTCPICQTRLPKDAVVSKRRADKEVTAIDRFDVLFFDRATPSTVRLAMAAREAGLLVVFEPPSLPRTSHAEYAASLSDILKVSLKPGQCPGQWRPAKGAHTRFIVETLGASGVQLTSRLGHGWGAEQKYPAIQQQAIRDTAGAGDWLTAGILYSLLLEGNTTDRGEIEEPVKYGQRLSALSLAFDGPQGALTALGGKTVIRMAETPGPLEVSHEAGMPSTGCGDGPRKDTDHCSLCLSEFRDRIG